MWMLEERIMGVLGWRLRLRLEAGRGRMEVMEESENGSEAGPRVEEEFNIFAGF